MIIFTRNRDEEIWVSTPQGVIRFKFFGSKRNSRNTATVGVDAPHGFPIFRGEKGASWIEADGSTPIVPNT